MGIPKKTRLESYEQISLVSDIRKQMILDVLGEYGELTAQELAAVLHKRGYVPSDERNFTAPRLTELRKAGMVEPTGKTLCKKTGRKVTLWAVAGKDGKK